MRLRQQYAMQRLVYGIDLLSKGAIVVTDRLHAHILCCLLNIPHFVFDSLGGKSPRSTGLGRKMMSAHSLSRQPPSSLKSGIQSHHKSSLYFTKHWSQYTQRRTCSRVYPCDLEHGPNNDAERVVAQ
jgi:Polysaccharide pyruvyl transferase